MTMRNHRNRTPTKPGRVLISPESGEPFYGTVIRADEPTDEGCPIDKVTLDELLAASGETQGTASALTLEQSGFQLVDGATVRFRLHTRSGAMPTLNISGTGAKSIIQQNGKPMKAGIAAGTWLTVIYSEALGNFILQGSGGDDIFIFGKSVNQVTSYEWFTVGGADPAYRGRFI